jgi:hypothetical protein
LNNHAILAACSAASMNTSPPNCPKCDYPATGNEPHTCPECGFVFTARSAWKVSRFPRWPEVLGLLYGALVVPAAPFLSPRGALGMYLVSALGVAAIPFLVWGLRRKRVSDALIYWLAFSWWAAVSGCVVFGALLFWALMNLAG